MGLLELLLIVLVIAAVAGGIGVSPVLWVLLLVALIVFLTGGGFGYPKRRPGLALPRRGCLPVPWGGPVGSAWFHRMAVQERRFCGPGRLKCEHRQPDASPGRARDRSER